MQTNRLRRLVLAPTAGFLIGSVVSYYMAITLYGIGYVSNAPVSQSFAVGALSIPIALLTSNISISGVRGAVGFIIGLVVAVLWYGQWFDQVMLVPLIVCLSFASIVGCVVALVTPAARDGLEQFIHGLFFSPHPDERANSGADVITQLGISDTPTFNASTRGER